jgi:hypothetical protein
MKDDTMEVTYALPDLWIKYGLRHSRLPVDSWYGKNAVRDMGRYYDLVTICHDRVSFYWEKHPEEAAKRHEVGHMYFDVCNKVAPKEVKEAAELAEIYMKVTK